MERMDKMLNLMAPQESNPNNNTNTSSTNDSKINQELSNLKDSIADLQRLVLNTNKDHPSPPRPTVRAVTFESNTTK